MKNDNILTRFRGIIAQDHEAKFYHFGDKHATCGAHLIRELKGMMELQMIPWAGEVRKYFLLMNQQKKEDLHSRKKSCAGELLCQYEAQYDELVEEGKKLLAKKVEKSFGYDELRRMVTHLEKYKDSYLLFMRDYEAPFTNNEANVTCAIVKPDRKCQDVSAAGRAFLIIARYAACCLPQKNVGKIF